MPGLVRELSADLAGEALAPFVPILFLCCSLRELTG